MIFKSMFTSAALAAGLLLPAVALPAGAFAQTETPVGAGDAQPAAPSGGHGPMMGHMSKAPMAKSPMAKSPMAKSMSRTERVEQHINQMHTRLHIAPAQQTQWDQFAQTMRDNAKDMDQALDQRGTGFASMNAADNLQSYAQLTQQHAQDTQKLATAFGALYGSMSDDQKKNADAVFRAQSDHHMQMHNKHG